MCRRSSRSRESAALERADTYHARHICEDRASIALHLKRQPAFRDACPCGRRDPDRHPPHRDRPQRFKVAAITPRRIRAIRTDALQLTSITRSRSRSTAATSPTIARRFDDHRENPLAPRSASRVSRSIIDGREISSRRATSATTAGSAIAARIRTGLLRSSPTPFVARDHVIRPMLCS